jgi:hypothetical protein
MSIDSGLFFIVGIALSLLLVLVIVGTVYRTRWGINVYRVKCPRCGTLAPLVRKPASAGQALWGGFTCPNCGCEVDKWGREIPKPGAAGG